MTTRTRPDQTHGRLGLRQVRGLCLVVDFSAQSQHVPTGLVWSGRRQGPWVRVVKFDTDQTLSETWSQARTCLVRSGPVRVAEFRNDTTRSDQRQSLVGPVPNSTTRTRTGPDLTRQSPRTCRKPARTQRILVSATWVSDVVWSGPPSGVWTQQLTGRAECGRGLDRAVRPRRASRRAASRSGRRRSASRTRACRPADAVSLAASSRTPRR